MIRWSWNLTRRPGISYQLLRSLPGWLNGHPWTLCPYLGIPLPNKAFHTGIRKLKQQEKLPPGCVSSWCFLQQCDQLLSKFTQAVGRGCGKVLRCLSKVIINYWMETFHWITFLYDLYIYVHVQSSEAHVLLNKKFQAFCLYIAH